jgi:hypothetical protein
MLHAADDKNFSGGQRSIEWEKKLELKKVNPAKTM